MHEIRKAQKGEEKLVKEIVKKVLADFDLTLNEKTDEDLRDFDAYYFKKGGWFGVLEYEGKIVGSYGLYNMGNQVCELRKMYLLPEYQGKGLGKMLMNHALKKARELGFSEMILESNSKLRQAHQMYKKYGFEEYTPEHLSHRCDFAMKLKL